MDWTLQNFYALWRAKSAQTIHLRDEHFPDERLLQTIWQHQRIKRDGLKTVGGKSVRIFHPGFCSVEGGPDFRDAVLQIGDDKPISCDVEIDLVSGSWRAHGHDKNSNFRNVKLHVVWDANRQIENAPEILSLKNFLAAPLTELSLSLENESSRSLPENLRGKCCAPLRELGEAKLLELLNQAAFVRFQSKADQILVRAKKCGWEQVLWENLLRALGYKNNIWPMQSLAEQKSKWFNNVKSAFELQALLFGIGGLLPAELTRAQKSSDTYLRHVWDLWWRRRDEFSEIILPREAWKFHGLRPANHPQRRLALVSHWLADKKFVSRIENWIANDVADKKLLESLHEILNVERDEFWSWHWTFKSERLKKAQPLLGESRVTDLVVNVILPWLWIRAREGGSQKIQREAERRFFAWPAAEDNSVLKLARQRLLGGSNLKMFKSSASQQGLHQIVKDFCGCSNAICLDCRFPEMVREWNAP